MSDNFYFETYTDSGCTITVRSTPDYVEIATYRLSNLIYFPLRYSFFIVAILYINFTNLNNHILVYTLLIIVLPAVFTNHTVLLPGRFLQPFHKYLGFQTRYLFFKSSFDPASRPSKNVFEFSFQDLESISIDGFNHKSDSFFYTFTMLTLQIAHYSSFILGGSFHGRFYTANRAQRIRLENLHSIIASILELPTPAFSRKDKEEPQPRERYHYHYDHEISAQNPDNQLNENINAIPLVSFPSSKFERYFYKMSKVEQNFDINEMWDMHFFILIMIGVLLFFSFSIFGGLLEFLDINTINSVLKSGIFSELTYKISFLFFFVSFQEQGRMARHLFLPWFAGKDLKYDFLNNLYLDQTSYVTPSTEPVNDDKDSKEKIFDDSELFPPPRNMLETFVLILLIPFLFTIGPWLWYRDYQKRNRGASSLLESGDLDDKAIKGFKMMRNIFIILFAPIWFLAFIATLGLIYIEGPLLLLYLGLRKLY